MTEPRTFRRYGEKKQGVHNKFYEVCAEETDDGARWTFTWGRIGSGGQSKTGVTYTFEHARQICIEKFEKKGYTEVTALEALASCCETLEERETNGLSPVEIRVPRFHAGKSEDRLQTFCKKYLTKLNVIRASRWDLGYAPYAKQIKTMLKQYCAEFKRIERSKTHGPNCGDNARTAFRIFFGLLKDDAGCTIYGHFEGAGVH